MTANEPEQEASAPETPAHTPRRATPRPMWRRRLRTARSRVLFTTLAAALCILFTLPFLYAVSQSLTSGPGLGAEGAPWYPVIQRTYQCTEPQLCATQNPFTGFRFRAGTLGVYDVPGHGTLALLQPDDPSNNLPAVFIDPQTNKRVEIVIDATTLAPVWDFHVSLDSFNSVFSFADSLTQAAPGGFLRWLINSGVIAGLSAIGAVLSAVLVAYGFARFKFRGRDGLFLVLIGTVLIPYQVTMIPQYILYHTIGWDASFLPLTLPNFFGNAFYIFLLRQYFMTLPRELDEAATVDGAGHFRILTDIIIPQAWPAIAAVALFQFLFSWNDFMGPLIYLFSWNDLTPVSLGLVYLNGSSAGAIVSLIVPLVLAILAQRAFMRGIVISGVET